MGIALCLVLIPGYGVFAAVQVLGVGGPEVYAREPDFVIDLIGAAIVRSGHPELLYDTATQTATQAAITQAVHLQIPVLVPFNHPPFEALFVAALQGLGFSAPATLAVWTVLGLLAVAAALAALRWGWPVLGTGGLLLTLAALTFYPLVRGLLLGQSTALLLLGWALGSAALRRGYDGWAGVALALATLKPQTIPVVLLILLVMRRWRALAAWAATVGAATVAVMPLLGADWPLRYLAFLWQVVLWPPTRVLTATTMQNWRGELARLLGESSLTTALALGLSVLAVGLLGALWWRIGAWRPGTPTWEHAWAATLLLAVLVSPHVEPQDLALALVPAWMLAVALAPADARAGRTWLWLGWALGFVAVRYDYFVLGPAVLWLTATTGWLLWRAWRLAPDTVLHPDSAPVLRAEAG